MGEGDFFAVGESGGGVGGGGDWRGEERASKKQRRCQLDI